MTTAIRFWFRRRSGLSTSATESAWCPVGTESEVAVVVDVHADAAADTTYEATERGSFSRRCYKLHFVGTYIEVFLAMSSWVRGITHKCRSVF